MTRSPRQQGFPSSPEPVASGPGAMQPNVTAADAEAERRLPPVQPPPPFPGIRARPRRAAKPHDHRLREQRLATVIVMGCLLVLLTLTVGLFVSGLQQSHDARSLPPNRPSRLARDDASSSRLGASPARTRRGRVQPAQAERERSLPEPSFDSSLLSDPPWAHNPRGTPYASNVSFDPQATIDVLVMERLAELGIEPAKLCSDEVFLRRLYIDALGTLPTTEEARAFLDDITPDKRSELVEHVLQRPEFADYWAMKWCDILRVKAEFPIKLWPNAAQAYHRWIRAAIKDNMPYDEFARQLLTSSGSNFRTPQVNFYRAMQSKTPEGVARAVALTFLGERTDGWTPERLQGVSVFFSQVAYKATDEWKEEIVFFDRRQGRDQKNGGPLTAIFPNGASISIPPGQDPRQVFADWLVNEQNPWFSRVIANRVWFWLLGRGIVDPPDDVRPNNAASNLPLLLHLGEELVHADYDLRHLLRLILNSETYQLACTHEARDSLAAENFAYYPVRRLDAEVIIDAICQITGTSESYSSIIPEPFTFLPEGQRAIALPDGSITSPFLEMFGRPSRDTGLESDRNNRLTAGQALHLLNSNHLRNKLKQGPALKELLSAATSQSETAELLYLTILSRRPTDAERAMVEGMCGHQAGARDVAWALINSDEFLFRH